MDTTSRVRPGGPPVSARPVGSRAVAFASLAPAGSRDTLAATRPAAASTEIRVRAATRHDADPIVALVRSERLNPSGLHWPRFVVAERAGRLVGAVQLRCHRDGGRELGSLVVVPDERGRGVAARLIDRLLVDVRGPVHMITGAAHAAHYAAWGFAVVPAREAPRSVRWNWRLGRMARIVSLLKGLPARRLVILRSHRADRTAP